MEDSTEGQKMDRSAQNYQEMYDSIINQSIIIEDGTPTRYHLKLKTNPSDQAEPYRKINFGEKAKNKPHKTILMVGETGTGKTTLINTMINYILGVQREDKVWFEITDDQSDRTSVHSQTSSVTVYGFYLQESPIHLTIIDTPGYGDTHAEIDKQIAVSLLSLCKSEETIHEIDAVCLVIKASQTRLSDRQKYIFDAVQSLFGKDIVENIVLLVTHSRGAIPKNVLMAVKEAKIKCAVNDQDQPVYFLFDNCQSDSADEDEVMLKQSWALSFNEMKKKFTFLKNVKPKSLEMTREVLQKREQLEENISKIQSLVQKIDKTQNDLKQNQKKPEPENKVLCQEDAENDSVVSASNCCDPRLWVSYLFCCISVGNYHYSQQVNAQINETETEDKKHENLKNEYDSKIGDVVPVDKKLEELQELKKKLVNEAFDCVETQSQSITFNTDSLKTLQHIDFLIDKMKEINEPEKAKKLETIKERAGEEKLKLLKKYMKR